MTILRIPGYSEGADLGGEPVNWLVYDTETKEQHVEPNPAYVPPPPPTELERLQWEAQDLEERLRETRAAIAALTKEQP